MWACVLLHEVADSHPGSIGPAASRTRSCDRERTGSISERQASLLQVGRTGSLATLTDRELHVFGLIGAGHGTGRIAGDLGLSRKTIETYQGRIKAKFGYRGARELHEGARKWFDSVKR